MLINTAEQIYFAPPLFLDSEVRTFLDSAKALAAKVPTELGEDDQDLKTIHSAAREDLLETLNKVVTHFEQQSRQQVKQIQKLEDIVLLVTWGFLLLEAFIIFMPMVRSISKSQKSIENALVEANKANLAKTDFLSAMSHEFRTPLNAVLGFAQILEHQDLSKKEMAAIQGITQAGNHLLDMANQMLDLMALEKGSLKIDLMPVSVVEVLARSIEWHLNVMDKKGLEYIDEISGKDIPKVFADKYRLTQILNNLISNAVKYNKDKGSITVSAELTNNDRLRISIKDTGIGIEQHRQEEIFQSFNRLGAENSSILGAGIGLVIVKTLVDAMDGKLGFTSTKDIGTEFWIEFPTA